MTINFQFTGPSAAGMKRVAPSMTVEGVPLTNVLVGLLWRIDATDGSSHAFDSGEVKLDLPNPEEFRDIDAIPAEDLEQWVTDRLDVDAVKARLAAEIASQVAPATVLV